VPNIIQLDFVRSTCQLLYKYQTEVSKNVALIKASV